MIFHKQLILFPVVTGLHVAQVVVRTLRTSSEV